MGYTHYIDHKRAIPSPAWSNIRASVVTLINNLPSTTDTAGGYYIESPLNIVDHNEDPVSAANAGAIFQDDETIWFNGGPREQDLDFETFVLPQRKADELPFIKTGRRPYDLLVCATLILTEHFAPGCKYIRSDGDKEDWRPALELVHRFVTDEARLPDRVAGRQPDFVPQEPFFVESQAASPTLFF